MAAKSLEQMIADFRKARQQLQGLQTRLPKIMGNECVRIVKENFVIQGYDSGTGIERWPARQPATDKKYDSRSGVKGSTYSSKNKILWQVGVLYDGIKYDIRSGRYVIVGVDLQLVPYAQIHNEGGSIYINGRWKTMYFSGNRFAKRGHGEGRNLVVKAHVIKEPKRKYMPLEKEGPNKKMLDAIRLKIDYEIKTILKDFKV